MGAHAKPWVKARAFELLEKQVPQREIARLLGVSAVSVSKWGRQMDSPMARAKRAGLVARHSAPAVLELDVPPASNGRAPTIGEQLERLRAENRALRRFITEVLATMV